MATAEYRRGHGTLIFRFDKALERKKSSQKSTRPRGAKDVVTFPGAIGRSDAWRHADG